MIIFDKLLDGMTHQSSPSNLKRKDSDQQNPIHSQTIETLLSRLFLPTPHSYIYAKGNGALSVQRIPSVYAREMERLSAKGPLILALNFFKLKYLSFLFFTSLNFLKIGIFNCNFLELSEN